MVAGSWLPRVALETVVGPVRVACAKEASPAHNTAIKILYLNDLMVFFFKGLN